MLGSGGGLKCFRKVREPSFGGVSGVPGRIWVRWFRGTNLKGKILRYRSGGFCVFVFKGMLIQENVTAFNIRSTRRRLSQHRHNASFPLPLPCCCPHYPHHCPDQFPIFQVSTFPVPLFPHLSPYDIHPTRFSPGK